MNRVIGACAAAALLAVVLLPAGASARTTRWTVRATLAGSYANSVTATPAARCAAHYAERVDGLRATFRSTRAIAYDTVARAFTGPLRYHVAGRWSVTGGYVAVVPQPDGTLGCDDHETPVSCSARVVFEDGRRTSTTGTARLAVDDNTRTAIVSRVDAPRLTEQYADAGAPPAGWPAVCTLSPDVEAIPAAPLFGLSATEVLDRALAAPLRLSPRRLASGRRAFTVSAATARPRSCPAQGFDPCHETGAFRLRMTLSPLHR